MSKLNQIVVKMATDAIIPARVDISKDPPAGEKRCKWLTLSPVTDVLLEDPEQCAKYIDRSAIGGGADLQHLACVELKYLYTPEGVEFLCFLVCSWRLVGSVAVNDCSKRKVRLQSGIRTPRTKLRR